MKFKIGDKARVKYTRNGDFIWKAGLIVIIDHIENGISINGNPYECVVKFDYNHARVLFEQLEPVAPDSSSWKKIEEIVNWNPTKENVDA